MKCTDWQNIHDTLVYGHEDPPRIDACCNFYENVMDLNQYTVLIVLAKIVSAKVLIFVLALALALLALQEIETSNEHDD